MDCEVVWTQHAERDVDGIIAYIATALASPIAAREHLDALEEAVDCIASAPLPYEVSQQPSLAARGLRVCFVKRYVMLYSYDGDRLVTIHRVFSTLRDYAAIIEREA